jgi:hypothetical protein
VGSGEAESDFDDVGGPDEGGFDDYDDGDDECGGDCGDDFDYDDAQASVVQQSFVPSGLEITMEGGMLQAARTVEKVSIGYERCSDVLILSN